MSNKKKLLPRATMDVGCIIVDDLDDKDIAVSPEVVAKLLKWTQSSLMPNRPAPSFVGDKVIAYADPAQGTDHCVVCKASSIDGKLHILEIKHKLNSI